MIRIICPQDPTIRSVERQGRRLNRWLDAASRIYVLLPNDGSKYKCHHLIKTWDSSDLIVFMGHGRSDSLIGSRGRMYDMIGGDDSLDKDSEDYYNDERFIDASTYGLLVGKSIVAFACETDLLAQKLLDAGAKAVVGFGKMPTSRMELEQDAHITERISNTMIAYINGALNVAFRDAFYMTHKMQGEIADVAVYFKMEVRRQVSLLLHSKAKYRYSIATVLYDIAKTVKVVGDKTVKV